MQISNHLSVEKEIFESKEIFVLESLKDKNGDCAYEILANSDTPNRGIRIRISRETSQKLAKELLLFLGEQ